MSFRFCFPPFYCYYSYLACSSWQEAGVYVSGSVKRAAAARIEQEARRMTARRHINQRYLDMREMVNVNTRRCFDVTT